MTGLTPADILREEVTLIETGLTVQRQGLDLLLAEMRALTALMPGQDGAAPDPGLTDAEVEASFDNMPV